MAGISDVQRFLDSLRDATRVLDAYTAKVRDGARATEQSSAAAARAAAQTSVLGQAASGIGGAIKDEGMSVAFKALGVAVNELVAMTEVVARKLAPDAFKAYEDGQDFRRAKEQTKEFARNMADVGFVVPEAMADKQLGYYEQRENRRSAASRRIEEAYETGESALFNHARARSSVQFRRSR